ncbi:MAG: hypothetical protein IJG60_01540 [Thermoguttaceae bacterium]|nr:hypothetical protein [Thermoguttaceae bacterium]
MHKRCVAFFTLVFCLCAAVLLAAESEMRIWTSSGGAHTLEAEYLGKKGKDKIYLLKKDDRLITVNLDALSAEDRAYVEEEENTDVDWTEDSKPSKAVYERARTRAVVLFVEIDAWKDDEDFQNTGFDPSGSFFRWQLQVKKLRKELGREPGNKDKKTNIGALTSAVDELQELGNEYAENSGSVTNQTRRKSEYIKRVFESLTQEPAGAPNRTVDESIAAAEEPNPFTEEPNPFEEDEGANSPKPKNEVGPKARKPKIEKGEDATGREEEKPSVRHRRKKNSGDGLIPLLGALAAPEEDEEEDVQETTEEEESAKENETGQKITYSQFKQVKMEMTKDKVFAILGKGTKVSIPFVDSILNTGMETYLWENGDELGGCEITFVDGKVDHKMWKGPKDDEQEDESDK